MTYKYFEMTGDFYISFVCVFWPFVGVFNNEIADQTMTVSLRLIYRLCSVCHSMHSYSIFQMLDLQYKQRCFCVSVDLNLQYDVSFALWNRFCCQFELMNYNMTHFPFLMVNRMVFDIFFVIKKNNCIILTRDICQKYRFRDKQISLA